MKLRYGYLISGIITGFILLISFFWTLPDGKMHVFYCDVGEGDAAYIRFPDGRDMLVDGGPNDAVLQCLGKHMPFWDRHINLVLLSHPQKDHLQGLISIFQRFRVDDFIKSDVAADSDGYKQLMQAVKTAHVPIRLVKQGSFVTVGSTTLSFVWPSNLQLAKKAGVGSVLGAATDNLNNYCLVFVLRYGKFDAFFPGDADDVVEPQYMERAVGSIQVLKVPHHGSKTGMTQDFVHWLRPNIAVISVGKNSYGHPSKEALDMLQSVGSKVLRTDKLGDIEVMTDGIAWSVKQ